MSKLFGTDGIRGIAGEDLTAQTAYNLGAAVAVLLYDGREESKGHDDGRNDGEQNAVRRPRVLLGRDTRRSGGMLSSALAAGLAAYGADVTDGGVLPTPAAAYLTSLHFDAGVVISASHNGAEYNGLKVFGSAGHKISDADEERLEGIMTSLPSHKSGGGIGTVGQTDLRREYIAHLKSAGASTSRKILFDLSCGAAVATAKDAFDGECYPGAEFIADAPDGLNINLNCGSTHMETLADRVVAGCYDIGIAFDGDADRCLAVDETGDIIDGDMIIAALAADLKRRGKLKENAVAVTSMSNLGLHLFCRDNGISAEITDVGDKYVFARMEEKNLSLGGEQSGHIILRDFANTGDGQLTAARIIALLAENPTQKASEIFSVMRRLPQVLLNVNVENSKKERAVSYGPMVALRGTYERILGDRGRILIRPSGTESLVRVMIEGEDAEQIKEMAYSLANLIVEGVK